MTQNLSYYALPHLDVAAGETTNKNYPTNSHVWSTREKDVLVWNGSSWQLPGDAFARFIYGITSITDLSQYRTALTGGEEGVNTGFSVVVGYVVHKLNAGRQRNLLNNGASVSSGGGWYFLLDQDNSVYGTLRRTPSPAQAVTSRHYLIGADIERVHVTALRYDGNSIDLVHGKVFTDPQPRGGTAYMPSVPSSDRLSFGSMSNFADNALPVDISFLGALSTKTYLDDAQVHEILDHFRTTGDFPARVTGVTLAHRYSVRETLRKQVVRSGQLAPMQIPDSATGVDVDALKRTGAPVMSALDLNTEGRVTYGVAGWVHGASYYSMQSGTTYGIMGAAEGFYVAALIIYQNGAGPASFGAGAHGWQLGNSSVSVSGVTTPAIPAAMSPLISGTLIHVALRFTGNEVQHWVNGVLSSRAAFTGTYVSYSSGGGGSMWLGQWQVGTSNQADTVFGLAGGHFIPTEDEMRVAAVNALATNRIQNIPGKTEHLWDLHQDIVESGQTAIPPNVCRDRIGVAHLWCHRSIRLAALHHTNTPYLNEGIAFPQPYGAAPSSIYTTPSGGLPGVTSGFWVSFLFTYLYTGVAQGSGCCYTADFKGWCSSLQANPAHAMTFLIGDGTQWKITSTSVLLNQYATTPQHVALVYDGAGTAKIYLNGVLRDSVAINFVPAVDKGTLLGHSYSTAASPQLGMAGGNFIPTDAEIATASAASIAARKIQVIPGKTERHWSYVDDRAEAGDAVPIAIKERITGELTPVNDAAMYITRNVKRNWPYEVAPTFYGVTGFSDANFYESVAGYGAGSPAGFWVALLFVPSLTTSAGIRTLVASGTSAANGWEIRTNATNNSLVSGIAEQYGSMGYSPARSLAAAHYEKLQFFIMTWDPASTGIVYHKTFFQRNLANSTARPTYVPSASDRIRIGCSPYTAAVPATNNTIVGLSMGRGVLSHMEAYRVFDTLMSEERMVGLHGRTDLLVDMTLDVKEAGGVVPTTLKNRVNGQTAFNLNGALSLEPIYHRSFGWG